MDIGGLVKAFFNNPGVGGVVVLLVFGVACLIYFFLTRWIIGTKNTVESSANADQSGNITS